MKSRYVHVKIQFIHVRETEHGIGFLDGADTEYRTGN
jgi:hypothetical protein